MSSLSVYDELIFLSYFYPCHTPIDITQMFEKMISGKYQGEIVRILVLDLASQGLLFDGKVRKVSGEIYDGGITR